MVWEAVFLLIVLKIPIVYLCLVVWWAIKEPQPEEGAAVVAQVEPTDPPPRCDWRQRLVRTPLRRGGPRRGPSRPPARTAYARAEEQR